MCGALIPRAPDAPSPYARPWAQPQGVPARADSSTSGLAVPRKCASPAHGPESAGKSPQLSPGSTDDSDRSDEIACDGSDTFCMKDGPDAVTRPLQAADQEVRFRFRKGWAPATKNSSSAVAREPSRAGHRNW